MSQDFQFFKVFKENEQFQKKTKLLAEIQECAFETYENVTVIIRDIVKKYEAE